MFCSGNWLKPKGLDFLKLHIVELGQKLEVTRMKLQTGKVEVSRCPVPGIPEVTGGTKGRGLCRKKES